MISTIVERPVFDDFLARFTTRTSPTAT